MKGVPMRRARYLLAAVVLLACAGLGKAGEEPLYDEKANASEQIAAALTQAKTGKNIVLVFGANWCPDCHALHAQMHKEELASLLKESFVVVKINVGGYDRNLDVAEK